MPNPLNSIPEIEQIQHLKFRWIRLNFEIEALEPLFLPPYKGSALRGGFGYSFRKVCCVLQQQDCADCTLNQACAYAYIFETPKTTGLDIQHQAANYPHPFIIEPPDNRETQIRAGERLVFSLVLLGKGIDFLPYFVFAFHQLGQMGLGKGRGKFRLNQVTFPAGAEITEEIRIYDHQSQTLNSDFVVSEWDRLLAFTAANCPEQLTLRFTTPTRILQHGRTLTQLPFDLFMRTLFRRLSLLGRIHCGHPWELPYGELIALAAQSVETAATHLRWVDWERYSTRQHQHMKLGGFVGEVTYRGNLQPFLPFILLGEATHVGKNTTFGLGRFLVEY